MSCLALIALACTLPASQGQGAAGVGPTPGTVQQPSTSPVVDDSANGRSMARWLGALRDGNWQVEYAPTAATWRVLILVYPNTDTDYKRLDGKKGHFVGSMGDNLLQTIRQEIAGIPGLVRVFSRGMCRFEPDVKVITRPLTLNDNGNGNVRITHQEPLDADFAPEIKQYNTPPRYDSVMVLYHPGEVPQDLAGAGGGGRGGTRATFNSGDPGRWAKNPKAAWGQVMSWGQGLIIHEWAHGLDGFFLSSGYSIQPLHHVYKYGRFGLDTIEFYPAIFQGLLLDESGLKSGYSRSVWMSGTPRSINPLPPVQLLAPLPGATITTEGVDLRWAPSTAPDGYEISLSNPEDAEAAPVLFTTRASRFRVPSGALKPGEYQWTVRAKKGTDRSAVGDKFALRVSEPAPTADCRVQGLVWDGDPVRREGGRVRVRADLRADSGVVAAYATVGLRYLYRTTDRAQVESDWKPVVLAPFGPGLISLEGEELDRLKSTTGGHTEIRTVAGESGFRRSQLFWLPQVGNTLEVKVEVPASGRYRLMVATASYPDNGRFQPLLDGVAIGEPVSLRPIGRVSSMRYFDLGEYTLAAGPHKFGWKCLDRAPESPGNAMGWNRLVLVPQE